MFKLDIKTLLSAKSFIIAAYNYIKGINSVYYNDIEAKEITFNSSSGVLYIVTNKDKFAEKVSNFSNYSIKDNVLTIYKNDNSSFKLEFK